MASCADVFEADGVDLDAYTTTASIEDLELVRRALGIESWNLYGSSYGTRLALEVLRHHRRQRPRPAAVLTPSTSAGRRRDRGHRDSASRHMPAQATLDDET